MSGNKEILKKAADIINQRRNKAKAVNDMRFEEINSKIPEICEINAQLARTGMEILTVMRSGGNTSEKLSKLKERNLEAQRMVKNLLKQNGYPENYLDIKYTCDKCLDTGTCGGRRCVCFKELTARLSTEKMNENSQIMLCSFDKFKLDYYQGKTPEETAKYRDTMSKTFNYCKEYAENFSRSSENILILGETGLGKTHLSLSIANEVLKKGFNVLYDSTINYLRQIESEHFGRSYENTDTLETLLSADLLILDDLGSEFETQFYNSIIYNIVNTRMCRNIPTIISTNLNHEEIQKKYDNRTASRLLASYNCLIFVGTDIRIIKRRKGEK